MRNGPDYIQFYPTLRCNQSCEFCFNRSMPFMPDMSLQDCLAMFDRLNVAGVRTIDFIGGEPTLHPHLSDIVHDATQRGLGVNISSNGTNTVVLDNLHGMGKNVAIGISINDRETLERLAGFIQKNGVVVKSIVRPSMDEALIHEILALKPKKFYLIYRDALDCADLPNTVPFPRFMQVLAQSFALPAVDTVYCSGFIPDAKNPQELLRVRCPAGTTKLGIMPDGSVYPCNLFFGRKEFFLGNVLADPFEAIWRNPVLAFFRTFSGNACLQRTCEFHGQCHGGCPAQALVVSGDLAAPDPRCFPDAFQHPAGVETLCRS